MKIAVYSQKGSKLKTKIDLNPRVFGVKINDALVSQYVRVYRSNQRQGTASVKRRGEVSGGGRKPWRQKGTGRARHGSIRSPLWVGGGKAHGPKPKNWGLSFPKKMKRKALFMALSAKAAQKKLFVVDKFAFKTFKTREWSQILDDLSLVKGKTLIILGENEKRLFLPARNIAGLKALPLVGLNAYAVLAANNLLVSKMTIKALQEFVGRERRRSEEGKNDQFK